LPAAGGFVSVRFGRHVRNIQKQISSGKPCGSHAQDHLMSESPHILVVEDDRDISRLVGRYLRDNDCRVSLAGNGHEMHEVMLSNRIDLVVLDVMLPGEDGLALVPPVARPLPHPGRHADCEGR
jgi:PleD family two-component response regulator